MPKLGYLSLQPPDDPKDWRAHNRIAAVRMAFQGFPVFPCHAYPELKSGKKAKSPLGPWKHWKPRAWQEIDEHWRGNWKDYLPGISLEAQDLVVIDIDVRDGIDGRPAWEKLCRENGGLPDGVIVTNSAGGGNHVWFRQRQDFKLGNSEGDLPDNTNVRGKGGLVIAPGAMLPDGRQWTYDEKIVFRNAPIIPDWLFNMIKPMIHALQEVASSAPCTPLVGGQDARYWEPAIRDEVEKYRNMLPETGRNIQLNTSAFNLAQMVRFGAITENEIRALLWEASGHNKHIRDYGPDQTRDSIESGLKAGLIKPRKDPPIKLNQPRIEAPTCHGAKPGEKFEKFENSGDSERDEDIERTAEALFVDLFLDGDGSEEIEFRTPIIEGLLDPNSIGTIGGQSGAGKTFVVSSLCVAIAALASWAGRDILENGGVLILDGESGDQDLRARIRAAKIGAGITGKLPILWKVNTKDLLRPENFKIAIDAIKWTKAYLQREFGVELKMVIIDTLSSTMTLGDEGAKELKAAIECLDKIREATRVPAVWGVHHYGKDAEKGLRGHSNLRGLTDQGIAVMAQRDPANPGELLKNGKRWISVERNRWGREGRICEFELPEVLVGKRQDGKDVFYPYMRPVFENKASEPNWEKFKLSKRSASVLKGIETAIERGLCFQYPISGLSRESMVHASAVTGSNLLSVMKELDPKPGTPKQIHERAYKAVYECADELVNAGMINVGMYKTEQIYWLV